MMQGRDLPSEQLNSPRRALPCRARLAPLPLACTDPSCWTGVSMAGGASMAPASLSVPKPLTPSPTSPAPPAPACPPSRWEAAAAGPCLPTHSARCAPRGGCRRARPRGSRPARREAERAGAARAASAAYASTGRPRRQAQRAAFVPRLHALANAYKRRAAAAAAHLHHPVDGGEVEASRRTGGGNQHQRLGLAKLVEHCMGGGGTAMGMLGPRSRRNKAPS